MFIASKPLLDLTRDVVRSSELDPTYHLVPCGAMLTPSCLQAVSQLPHDVWGWQQRTSIARVTGHSAPSREDGTRNFVSVVENRVEMVYRNVESKYSGLLYCIVCLCCQYHGSTDLLLMSLRMHNATQNSTGVVLPERIRCCYAACDSVRVLNTRTFELLLTRTLFLLSGCSHTLKTIVLYHLILNSTSFLLKVCDGFGDRT